MITQTELWKQEAEAKGSSDGKVLYDLLRRHCPAEMLEGIRYYRNNADIKRRIISRMEGGVRRIDETKENRRVPNGWHKLLVDQKTAYLCGNPVTFHTDDEQFTGQINRYLGEAFDDALCELIKGASNKGVEWLQVYLDERGVFRFAVIPAEEVIPIRDATKEDRLTGVIRRYVMEEENEKVHYVEWWNEMTVKHFVENASGRVSFLREEPHFTVNGQGYGWGRVPMIPFCNNREMLSDLTFYKELIDNYDLALSDLCNDLAEVQEAVMVLKGYDGTDLQEFSDNLRYYKVIKVAGGDGSGVDKLEISIPVEAKRELLDRLEENIFLFGQGVNMKTDRFGNDPSGVALKFLYSLLDMKAAVTERKCKTAIRQLLWFLTEYLHLRGEGEYDPESVTVVFGKRLIVNDYEAAQIATMSDGLLSQRTILAHHPWVEDVDEEQKGGEKNGVAAKHSTDAGEDGGRADGNSGGDS